MIIYYIIYNFIFIKLYIYNIININIRTSLKKFIYFIKKNFKTNF